ncbi:aspartate--tRNA ligase [bacterium]|nr:aspartate--tRNA ligase [bacterium]
MTVYRTHTCGELRQSHADERVVLSGWAARIRDLGGLIFLTVRDRYGRTQVVFDPDRSEELVLEAKRVRQEWVVRIEGMVRTRPEQDRNADMPTGDIEVVADRLEVLASCETPPLLPEDDFVPSEEHRLRHRFLDLRRARMQKILVTRHNLLQTVRRVLSKQGFLEIETPYLTRSTPEGARDFIVPSRLHPGQWYALPQSPQTYKQILMVSGFDRYFQVVRCFRDEDFRANRQPEFTQIDIEAAFVDEEQIRETAETLMKAVFEQALEIPFPTAVPRMTYRDAMQRYGTDKPDTRYGQELVDLTDHLAGHGFGVVDGISKAGGGAVGLCVQGQAAVSRSWIKKWEEFVKQRGLGGLMPLRVQEDGSWANPLGKFIPAEQLQKAADALQMGEDDLGLIALDKGMRRFEVMGMLRSALAQELGWIDESRHELLWVTDFPLVEWNEEEERYDALHHPFTAPRYEEWERWRETDPSRIMSRAYDLVWNGHEVAGGSIRIHDRTWQEKVFGLIGLSPEEASKRFSFLMEALQYGAPPHGGIAFGFDRMVMLATGETSIRNVIAFPKTTAGMALFEGAPGVVDEDQLHELHLQEIKPKGETGEND